MSGREEKIGNEYKMKLKIWRRALEGQYQSVAGKEGSSKSQQKWEAMRIGDVTGKLVLDLGCNEGFFVEKFVELGASKVVGVDLNAQLISRARERVPGGEFHVANWEEYLEGEPENKYDIVIMLSALHYAGNYSEILRKIHRVLKRDGVFVLEASVDPNRHGYLVPVERKSDVATDTVFHFTGPALLEVASKWFGVRWVSQSVMQPGDPVKRAVYYLYPNRPFAMLIMGKSGAGKSRLVSEMVDKSVSVFSVDKFVLQVMETGYTAIGKEMKAVHQMGRLDKVYEMLMDGEKWKILLKYIERHFEGNKNIAIESSLLEYPEFRAAIKEGLRRRGYIVAETTI